MSIPEAIARVTLPAAASRAEKEVSCRREGPSLRRGPCPIFSGTSAAFLSLGFSVFLMSFALGS